MSTILHHFQFAVHFFSIHPLNDCDGQSIYSAKRVDSVVLNVVRNYLDKIKKTPKDKALEMRYKKELSEKNKIRNELQKEHDKLKKRLTELSLEVGKSLSVRISSRWMYSQCR